MNENIDLTKILEGCPVGTKFYSSVYGKVDFSRIISDDYGKCPIELMGYNKCTHSIAAVYCEKDGTFNCDYEGGECTLFPSEDQRDWSKFVRFWDKPEKVDRFDPNTLKPFDKILVRKVYTPWNISPWSCEYFNYIHPNTRHLVDGISSKYDICIPYNDETKHLLGTTDDCPEHYKWWKIENDFV